jgi:hypothetical protein
MIEYLRIPKNKFWGWVLSSVTIGLVLGAGGSYAAGKITASGETEDLKAQLASQSAQATAKLADLQARLDSTTASLTALSQQYAQLQSSVDTDTASDDKSSDSGDDKKLEVLSRKVSPSSVATGADLTLSAKVQGGPDKVTLRIVNRTNGFDETYSLKKSSTSDGEQTWKKTISAPKKKGTYTYYATAYKDGKTATMPGASPSKFTVE